jgi:hypothetical protein
MTPVSDHGSEGMTSGADLSMPGGGCSKMPEGVDMAPRRWRFGGSCFGCGTAGASLYFFIIDGPGCLDMLTSCLIFAVSVGCSLRGAITLRFCRVMRAVPFFELASGSSVSTLALSLPASSFLSRPKTRVLTLLVGLRVVRVFFWVFSAATVPFMSLLSSSEFTTAALLYSLLSLR